MKTFKKLLRTIFIVIYPNFLFTADFTKSDLNYLNFNDKKFFIDKCFQKENFIDTPKCLNFLGLKIFLNNIENSETIRENLKYIENQSIYYLREAAKRGYIDAYINLAWIYSNEKFGLQDLKKSAEYFNIYQNIKSLGLQTNNSQKEKKNQIKIDEKQIVLSILIMKKLDLYKKYNIDRENYYLTEKEYKKGKKIFKEIINISNLSVLEIDTMKQEIFNKNKAKLYELESDLGVFEKKYRRIVIKELNKLKEILQELK